MPRIHYDEESINAFVIPNLKQSIENLNKAISCCINLNVTANLSCKNEINELDSFLINKRDRISNINSILSKSHSISNVSYEEVKSKVSTLNQGQLDKRESSI